MNKCIVIGLIVMINVAIGAHMYIGHGDVKDRLERLEKKEMKVEKNAQGGYTFIFDNPDEDKIEHVNMFEFLKRYMPLEESNET